MTKSYNNVSDMIKDSPLSSESKKNIITKLHKNRIAKFLFAIRSLKKISQSELAEKIGCSQAKISKIERTPDENFSIKDLQDYCNALDTNFEIIFKNKNLKIVDEIKHHAFMIKERLDKLAHLVEDDEKMKEAYDDFITECFVNLVKICEDSASKVKVKKAPREVMQISSIPQKIESKENDMVASRKD